MLILEKPNAPPPPFHMSDVDDNVPVFPMRTDSGVDLPVPDATYVNMESILSLDSNSEPNYAEYRLSGQGLSSSATITRDGRMAISLDLKQKLPKLPKDHARNVNEFAVDATQWKDVPPMNILVMIVGSRGDVQPYVALGKKLLEDGHRVRIASHETFRSFVVDNGLEFFDIGGNPQDLMSYMVKNPGLIPGMESLTNGDILKKRRMLAEMMNGCWLACQSPCQTSGRSFAADAIISNPPAFAHVHCAEALGIPLLLSFTMPWSPTTAFPHPLVNVRSSNADNGLTNVLSYALADLLTWQGIGDIVNKFRTKSLGLPPLSVRSGPGLIDRIKIPWTYCMSPALVAKPKDWMNYIDVVGFYFLDLATHYEPSEDLVQFLAAGAPPIYIGFGSVVVDNAKALTQTIFEAVSQAGVRALVSAGWGGLGDVSVPDNIFILGNVPHDWLFSEGRVSAVIHHGGAGTTAVGLAKGRPTLVVPFFGDQAFWGSMIHQAGAGPEPIPHKKLNVENLRDGIKFLISPAAQHAAQAMAERIRDEDGSRAGVDSFYQHLPLLNMRCDLDPKRLAVWWSTKHCLKLSTFAAQTLANAKLLNMNELDKHRTKEYESQTKAVEPLTGGAIALFWTLTHVSVGLAELFYRPRKGLIHTTTAIPRGVVNIVSNIHEGFYNVPEMCGSNIRKPGKVTDFTSGMKEAGKGLYYGFYDGITGLVRDPIAGAKKDGVVGAIKGHARSLVKITMLPSAGMVGLVAHPFNGAWKDLQSAFHRKQEQTQHITRVCDGLTAVSESTSAERDDIVQQFAKARLEAPIRRNRMKELAERAIFGEPDTSQSSRRRSHMSESDTSSEASESPATRVRPKFERAWKGLTMFNRSQDKRRSFIIDDPDTEIDDSSATFINEFRRAQSYTERRKLMESWVEASVPQDEGTTGNATLEEHEQAVWDTSASSPHLSPPPYSLQQRVETPVASSSTVPSTHTFDREIHVQEFIEDEALFQLYLDGLADELSASETSNQHL